MDKVDAFFGWPLLNGISARLPSHPNFSTKRESFSEMSMIDEPKNIAKNVSIYSGFTKRERPLEIRA
jgi:hypothetical protein